MRVTEGQIQGLCEYLTSLYFVERNYKQILGYMDDRISFVCAHDNGLCLNKEDIANYLFDLPVDAPAALIETENYIINKISKTVYNVIAFLKIRSLADQDAKHTCFCFSTTWTKENDTWQIIHVHNSQLDECAKDTNFKKTIKRTNKLTMIEDIRKASFIDPLTQIYNYQGFENKAEALLQSNEKTKYAIIKFGVRDFRFINRKYGYQVGDQVLCSIAENLQKLLRDEETCGRMEKDIYAMLWKVKSKADLERRMWKIEKHLLDKDVISHMDRKIQLVAGIYMIQDNRGEHFKDMLDKAELAMRNIVYTVQKSHFILYEDWMIDKQFQTLQVLDEAPKAMKEEAFQVYIQPQFDVASGEVIGGEALVRWQLSDGTIRLPDEFIQVFEKRGMILSFDFYMLEKVCKCMRIWLDHGRTVVPISINQSQMHIEEPDYLKNFCAIVDKYQIPRDSIIIELTESAFVENSEKTAELANEVHDAGFQLAIDDFGTGFASLTLLKLISASILKIDKTFLQEVDTNKKAYKIMEMMVELAHQIDMKVVCEGIETEKHMAFVKQLSCDMGQGYLLGRPIPADDFEAVWLTPSKEG